MADNIWDNSDADNDGNNVNNWSLGALNATDVLVFDSATTSANCTFSAAHSCAGIRFDNTYTGTVDAVTFAVTIGATGLDCTNGGSATLDLGSGAWTCSGDWDTEDIGTHVVTTSGSTVTLTGSSKTFAGFVGNASGVALRDLTITGTYTATVTSGEISIGRDLKVDAGVLTIAASAVVNTRNLYGGGTGVFFQNLGTITGAGTLVIEANQEIAELTGTLDVATLDIAGSSAESTPENGILPAGTYGSATVRIGQVSGSLTSGRATRFAAGSFVFSGDVTFGAGQNGGTCTVDLATNNPDIEFRGDVAFVEAFGNALTWSKGTGGFTFGGTATQAVDFEGATSGAIGVEDIEINKTAGKVTLAGDMETDSFTGTDGELDIDGNNLTSVGAVTAAANFTFSDTAAGGLITCDTLDLNGTAGNVVTWNGPDLNVTGATAICDYTTATNSDASAGLEIDATNNGVDGTGNTNWDFSAATTAIAIDTAQIEDSFSVTTIHRRLISDTISFSDSVSRSVIVARLISENFLFVDSASRSAIISRLVAETFSLDDEVLRSLTALRAIVDTIDFQDADFESSTLKRLISDTINMTDNTSSLISGGAQTPIHHLIAGGM